MLNAFPLPSVSLHVKFPDVSFFIPVQKNPKFQLAETLLAIVVPDRSSLLASRDFHLPPSAALDLCKHWGTAWHLALNPSLNCSISHPLD